jgi:DNA polymerase I
LLSLFRAGHEDVYRSMAAVIFKRQSADEVTVSERDRAKTVCLGVIYGMGAPAMATRLNIEVAVAAQIMNSFFERFKQVQSWIARVKA